MVIFRFGFSLLPIMMVSTRKLTLVSVFIHFWRRDGFLHFNCTFGRYPIVEFDNVSVGRVTPGFFLQSSEFIFHLLHNFHRTFLDHFPPFHSQLLFVCHFPQRRNGVSHFLCRQNPFLNAPSPLIFIPISISISFSIPSTLLPIPLVIHLLCPLGKQRFPPKILLSLAIFVIVSIDQFNKRFHHLFAFQSDLDPIIPGWFFDFDDFDVQVIVSIEPGRDEFFEFFGAEEFEHVMNDYFFGGVVPVFFVIFMLGFGVPVVVVGGGG
mmetsp:Transcript_9865/g.19925  ORF Transcript_9865/g.19925 Transcript_9865/m.19925 type:complete len:265 (+) Transcript_9865:1-795(+)